MRGPGWVDEERGRRRGKRVTERNEVGIESENDRERETMRNRKRLT